MMNILYQSDENYAPFMDVSIYSLLKNNEHIDAITIYIIDDGISAQSKQKIATEIIGFGRSYEFIDAREIMSDSRLKDYPQYAGSRKNAHSFLKLFAGNILPETVSRILYIDCDTLVLDRLDDLISYDLHGNTLGMAMDCLVVEKKEMIGLSPDDRYYNSGVILFDLSKWREINAEERVLRHAMHHSYGTVDQDLLNVEFRNDIQCLPIRYNYQPFHLVYQNKVYFRYFPHKEGVYYTPNEIDSARNRICIMHFFRYIGEQPWHANNVHPCTPYFDAYLKETQFKGYTKKSANKGFVFQAEKMMYKIIPHTWFLWIWNRFFAIKLEMDQKANNEKK